MHEQIFQIQRGPGEKGRVVEKEGRIGDHATVQLGDQDLVPRPLAERVLDEALDRLVGGSGQLLEFGQRAHERDKSRRILGPRGPHHEWIVHEATSRLRFARANRVQASPATKIRKGAMVRTDSQLASVSTRHAKGAFSPEWRHSAAAVTSSPVSASPATRPEANRVPRSMRGPAASPPGEKRAAAPARRPPRISDDEVSSGR